MKFDFILNIDAENDAPSFGFIAMILSMIDETVWLKILAQTRALIMSIAFSPRWVLAIGYIKNIV